MSRLNLQKWQLVFRSLTQVTHYFAELSKTACKAEATFVDVKVNPRSALKSIDNANCKSTPVNQICFPIRGHEHLAQPLYYRNDVGLGLRALLVPRFDMEWALARWVVLSLVSLAPADAQSACAAGTYTVKTAGALCSRFLLVPMCIVAERQLVLEIYLMRWAHISGGETKGRVE